METGFQDTRESGCLSLASDPGGGLLHGLLALGGGLLLGVLGGGGSGLLGGGGLGGLLRVLGSPETIVRKSLRNCQNTSGKWARSPIHEM